jgi:hypothetical protein
VLELMRTNDIVLISVVRSLMSEAGIALHVADEHVSAVEGSIGILPRRLLVPADRADEARTLLREAGLVAELPEASRGR